MLCCLTTYLLLLPLLILCCTAGDEFKELAECPYIDPIQELERWNSFDYSSCKITNPQLQPSENASAEYARYMTGYKHYSFNVLVSDKLGPKRTFDEAVAHEKCYLVDYSTVYLTTSIVLIYHNEAFSVLVRMVNSILAETPQNILAEIILYDDFSNQELTLEEALKQYAMIEGWDFKKIKFFKSEKREGLIRAKVFASRKATADVLVFLDSHCEVTKGWILPLLLPIQQDKTRSRKRRRSRIAEAQVFLRGIQAILAIKHTKKYSTQSLEKISELIKKQRKRIGQGRKETSRAQGGGCTLNFKDLDIKPGIWVRERLAKKLRVSKRTIRQQTERMFRRLIRVVLPIVDLIDPLKFEYSKAMVTKGTFDWSLNFQWDYFEWSHFDDEDNYVRPFKTVAMSGGLLAIHREYFKHIGEYDEGMEIWGAENIEMSVRVWLCGGSLLVAPCSRVGHVFRMRRPYTGKPGVDTNLYNSMRTVEVWFDEYKKYFYERQPLATKMNVGDLTKRLKLKESLNCKPFSWFLEHIHPGLNSAEEKHKTEL